MNRGVAVDLDAGGGEFSVHECAAVLKSFLSDLPEPLLTDACYRAHCQVARMDAGEPEAREKRVQCLQLLLLVVPEPNYALLKDLLKLLKRVTEREEDNRMSASNLGTVFAPLLLCPRKLSAEALQSNVRLLASAVTFMIEEADGLFRLPERLRTDVDSYLRNRRNRAQTPEKMPSLDKGRDGDGSSSPVVNTVFSFVDREKTSRLAAETSTEAHLAELYAQVQAMPESAQKRRLISKLNDANGHGTPGLFSRGGGHVAKTKASGASEGLKNLLTPRRGKANDKMVGRGAHGSYSFKVPSATKPLLHSFRRQNSEQAGGSSAIAKVTGLNQKLLSPQSSPAMLVSPSALDSIAKKVGGSDDAEDLDGSYVAPKMSTFKPEEDDEDARTPVKTPGPPPVPQRVSSLSSSKQRSFDSESTATTADEASPLSNCANKMTGEMKREMMTPRNRRPMFTAPSAGELAKDEEGFKVRLFEHIAGLEASTFVSTGPCPGARTAAPESLPASKV